MDPPLGRCHVKSVFTTPQDPAPLLDAQVPKNSTKKTRLAQRFNLLAHVGDEASQFRQAGTFSAPLLGVSHLDFIGP